MGFVADTKSPSPTPSSSPGGGYDKNAAISAINGGGGAAPVGAGGFGPDPAYVPIIPVRKWGQRFAAQNESTSANAAEHSLSQGPQSKYTTDGAANAIFGWDEADQRAFARHAWYLGGIKSPDDLAGAWNLWQQAVKVAAGFAQAGNPMDPADVLDMMLTGDPGAAKERKMRAEGGVITQKSRSINVASAQDAKALIVEAFKTAVGREPTDAELRTYTNSLQSAMKANPSVTTTTQKIDPTTGQVVDTNSTTTGGMNASGAQQFVNDQLAVDPQAAEYQAAASYFPALLNALGPASGMMSGG